MLDEGEVKAMLNTPAYYGTKNDTLKKFYRTGHRICSEIFPKIFATRGKHVLDHCMFDYYSVLDN
jgi:hypothetical protein